MGVCRIQKRTLVCIDGNVFTSKITPIAFRVYCQLLYESEFHSFGESYEIDFDNYGISNDQVNLAYQELISLGFIAKKDDVVEIIDLNPSSVSFPVPKSKIEKVEESYIYVIHAMDLRLHKIGYTNNVARRYKELRHQQIPSDLGLVASYKIENAGKVENYLHNLFASKETHSEWFSLSKKDLSLLHSTLERMGGIREPN